MAAKGTLFLQLLFETESLFHHPQNLFLCSLRTYRLKMSADAVKRLLRRAVASAEVAAIKLFGGGEQRPSPAIFVAVAVGRIDEVLGDDARGHL